MLVGPPGRSIDGHSTGAPGARGAASEGRPANVTDLSKTATAPWTGANDPIRGAAIERQVSPSPGSPEGTKAMIEPEHRGPQALGWVVLVLFTGLCGLAAYIQCTGIHQLPL